MNPKAKRKPKMRHRTLKRGMMGRAFAAVARRGAAEVCVSMKRSPLTRVSRMLAAPPPFPKQVPPEYEMLHDEPAFDPARHLALEPPAKVWRLADLGYGAD